jgi:hypothetical protein
VYNINIFRDNLGCKEKTTEAGIFTISGEECKRAAGDEFAKKGSRKQPVSRAGKEKREKRTGQKPPRLPVGGTAKQRRPISSAAGKPREFQPASGQIGYD